MTQFVSDADVWLVDVSDDCVASSQCVMTAPDLFALNDDGFSYPLQNPVSVARSRDLDEAVDGCPSGAIRIIRQAT
jgi:ferredoxin